MLLNCLNYLFNLSLTVMFQLHFLQSIFKCIIININIENCESATANKSPPAKAIKTQTNVIAPNSVAFIYLKKILKIANCETATTSVLISVIKESIKSN